jgi:hypothetical protein
MSHNIVTHTVYAFIEYAGKLPGLKTQNVILISHSNKKPNLNYGLRIFYTVQFYTVGNKTLLLPDFSDLKQRRRLFE